MSTINLMLGDCLERMKEIPDGSVDMVLCDPPYGTTACKWDSVIDLHLMWEQLKRVIKLNGAIVLTASQPFTSVLISSNLKMFKYEWIWQKNQPSGMALANRMPMKYHENVCVFYSKQPLYSKQPTKRGSEAAKKVVVRGVRGGHSTVENGAKLNVAEIRYYDPENVNPKSILDILCVPNGGGGRLHPTQKPIALMEYFINTYTNEGETVLDFTMGSGTTGVACVNTNRNFIGIEMDEKYFKIATDRINNSKGNLIEH